MNVEGMKIAISPQDNGHDVTLSNGTDRKVVYTLQDQLPLIMGELRRGEEKTFFVASLDSGKPRHLLFSHCLGKVKIG